MPPPFPATLPGAKLCGLEHALVQRGENLFPGLVRPDRPRQKAVRPVFKSHFTNLKQQSEAYFVDRVHQCLRTTCCGQVVARLACVWLAPSHLDWTERGWLQGTLLLSCL